jgi:hypothetical protein
MDLPGLGIGCIEKVKQRAIFTAHQESHAIGFSPPMKDLLDLEMLTLKLKGPRALRVTAAGIAVNG